MSEKFKHSFQKKWGQNFLRNDRFAKILVNAAELTADDVVIEVGPGDGRVTNLLLATGAKVLAIEVDYNLLANLIKRFGQDDKFQLVNMDFMQVDILAELTKLGWGTKFKIVGSLPYNISKLIIQKLITDQVLPEVCSFIVQEEVAQDYSAKAPKASFLSNWVQIHAEVKKLETIPKAQFHPSPKVNGGILLIKPQHKLSAKQQDDLRRILRVGFSNPRKTLWNNLRNVEPFKTIGLEKLAATNNIAQLIRPAEVEFATWVELAK